MKVSKETIREICAQAKVEAREDRDRQLKIWKGEKDMQDMVRGDCRDICKVATLANQGKFGEALELARYMDTAARESIPDDLWNLIHAMDPDDPEAYEDFLEKEKRIREERDQKQKQIDDEVRRRLQPIYEVIDEHRGLPHPSCETTIPEKAARLLKEKLDKI